MNSGFDRSYLELGGFMTPTVFGICFAGSFVRSGSSAVGQTIQPHTAVWIFGVDEYYRMVVTKCESFSQFTAAYQFKFSPADQWQVTHVGGVYAAVLALASMATDEGALMAAATSHGEATL